MLQTPGLQVNSKGSQGEIFVWRMAFSDSTLLINIYFKSWPMTQKQIKLKMNICGLKITKNEFVVPRVEVERGQGQGHLPGGR